VVDDGEWQLEVWNVDLWRVAMFKKVGLETGHKLLSRNLQEGDDDHETSHWNWLQLMEELVYDAEVEGYPRIW